MALKIKKTTRIDGIFEDLRRLFRSENIDINSFYQYLEQIKDSLESVSQKEIRYQQMLDKQKYKKDIKKREEKRRENYLWMSRGLQI